MSSSGDRDFIVTGDKTQLFGIQGTICFNSCRQGGRALVATCGCPSGKRLQGAGLKGKKNSNNFSSKSCR